MGRTAGSEPVNRGSTPCLPANFHARYGSAEALLTIEPFGVYSGESMPQFCSGPSTVFGVVRVDGSFGPQSCVARIGVRLESRIVKTRVLDVRHSGRHAKSFQSAGGSETSGTRSLLMEEGNVDRGDLCAP